MDTEFTSAIIASIVSVIGILVSYLIAQQGRKVERALHREEIEASEARMRAELKARREEWRTDLVAHERQWQEGFRAELRRDLVRESSLETVRRRMALYGDVWKTLKVTAGYEWRRLEDPKATVQQLAHTLTDYAYSEVGMLMSDRSRRLLLYLRAGCGALLHDETSAQELVNRAHLLKHSLRSDLGIITEEYESDLHEIARSLGRVDDWTPSN